LELLTGLLDAVHLFHGKAIILIWERLCLYPALLVQYAAWIAALHRGNFNALANLDLRLFAPVESTHRFPLASLQSRTASWLLERYFAYESTAATAFDRFENFLGMVPMTSIQTSGGGSAATCGGPMGSTGSTLSRTLHGSCKAMAARLLGAGVFNGIAHRLKRAAKTFERFVRNRFIDSRRPDPNQILVIEIWSPLGDARRLTSTSCRSLEQVGNSEVG
jgi:hypothetical protein